MLDDLVGFTVVVPVAAHEADVLAWLATTFEETNRRSRDTTPKPPDVFRFDATRWYGKVRSTQGTKLQARAHKITFEVQVKTAFEHAWSSVTHDLVYKGNNPAWQPKRLAAQLKAMVEQIDLLVNTFDAAASGIAVSADRRTDSDARTVAKFKNLFKTGALPATLEPDSWQRFADSIYTLAAKSGGDAPTVIGRLDRLVDAFVAALEAGTFEPATSGSLMQCVTGFVGKHFSAVKLAKVPIMDSPELELYALEKPARTVDLDN